MNIRKNPKNDLENRRSVFLLSGLVVALALAIFVIEWKFYDQEIRETGETIHPLEMEDDFPPVTSYSMKKPARKKEPTGRVDPEPDQKPDTHTQLDIPDEVIGQTGEKNPDDLEPIGLEPEGANEPIPFVVVQNRPVFPGCEDAGSEIEQFHCFQRELNKSVTGNFVYPEIALKLGIEGRPTVKFVIEKDGSIGQVEILKSSGDPHIDKAAVKAVQKVPRMKPAEQLGKPVPVSYHIPVNVNVR